MSAFANLYTEDFGAEIDNRLTIEWLLSLLTPEEREILLLWKVEELNFKEIGKIIGKKYRADGEPLTGSAIRYHKEQIIEKLQPYREALGLDK